MSINARSSAPKLLGADFELGNFILGRTGPRDTCDEAARRLLAELEGVPASRSSQYGLWSGTGTNGGSSYNSGYGGYAYGWGWNYQDRDRRFFEQNGGGAYIDMSHAELTLPETMSASDFVAAYHAMLRRAQQALRRAQQDMPEGEHLQVIVNNSDGLSNSYGAHLNFLITRQLWDDLMERRPHYLAFLATHQVTSILYTGQGKVGSENGRPAVDFQLAQRADFFEMLRAQQTTHERPIVNSRNESLCGDRDDDFARLHHIFSDAGLAQLATFLKVGTMQLVLAMLEAGDIAVDLLIDEPVQAVVEISHDLSLKRPVSLAQGGEATALEVQRGLLERALRHGDRTGFPTVPGAGTILERWEDTLDRLETGDLAAVSDRLDWAAKLSLIELARGETGCWDRPELKHLDLLYGSLDPEDGLYWALEAAGSFETVVEDSAIEHFMHEPPDDTRAWTRAMLLRRFGDTGQIERVDWDRVVVVLEDADGIPRRCDFALDDPCGHTKADNEHLFNPAAASAVASIGGVAPNPRSN